MRWNVTHMVRLLQHAAMRQMVLERVSGPAALRRAAGVVLDCLCRAQEEVWLSQSSSHPLLHSYKAETVKRERDDAQSLGLGADEIGASSPSPSSSSLGSALARQGGGGGGGGIGRPATLQQTMKNGFPPPLPRQASATVSREGIVASCLAVMRDSVPNEGAAAAVGLVADVLRQLQDSAMGQTGLLGEGGAGMGRGGFMFPSGGGDAYALSYAPLLAAVLDVVVEKVVFARHGVLGTRVFHLLRRHHFLEDRTIAEHLIAPQPRTREVLHEMLRDGLLQQKEISKEDVNMTAERNPKKQVYLWGVQESSQLRPTVRQRVATALLHALQRLAATREQHSEISPIVARAASSAAAAVATSNDDLMTKRVKREVSEEEEVRGQGTVHEGVPWNREKVQGGPSDADVAVMNAYRQVVGLEHVVLAHMRLLFVLDYFY